MAMLCVNLLIYLPCFPRHVAVVAALSLPACVWVQSGQAVAVSDYLRVPCFLLFSWLVSSPCFPIPSRLSSPCSLCSVPL